MMIAVWLFMIICEMTIAFIAHAYAFPASPYAKTSKSYLNVHGHQRLCRPWNRQRQYIGTTTSSLSAVSFGPTTQSSDRALHTASLDTYVDSRGIKWTYGYDKVEPVQGTVRHRTPIVLVHTPAGLGVNRQFWNPFFRTISNSKDKGGALLDTDVYRFDWVGNGDSEPKPESVSEAFDCSYFTAQLQHFIENCVQIDEFGNKDKSIKPIIVVQGSAIPITIQYFADYGEDLCSGFIIGTGISTKFISEPPSKRIRSISWNLLKSPLGMVFFNYVSSRNYITNFVKKNFFLPNTAPEIIEEWIENAFVGCRDCRVRFNVYSFISGHFFDDYTEQLKKLSLPTLFLLGDSLPDKTVGKRLKSGRPPVPIVAAEKAFQDDRLKRLQWYVESIPGCEGKMIEDCGSEIPWEQPLKFAQEISLFQDRLNKS